MERYRSLLPILVPLVAMVLTGFVMLSLGSLFIATGRMATIYIGVAIVCLAPAVGYVLIRRDRSS